MPNRNFYLSRTNILGFLTIVASLGGWAVGQDFIQDNPTVITGIGAVIGCITVILRTYSTKGPVEGPIQSLKSPDNKPPMMHVK